MKEIDLISEWLDTARNDYIAAKHLFEDIRPRQIEIASYHCQQSVEKSLKAFLIFNGIDPPYTHNLEDLCSKCEESESGFSAFADSCVKLSPYATVTRYPKKADITEEEAAYAVEKAKEIFEFVYGLIPGLDEGLR
ncbi:MAG: HEPN domain-containing protein [Clostridiales bacterium]|nr:HEPN domain-containing protein [Clostridiales bacterium]